ncbi:MAG TPA: SH3 domain-containing protein [Candidatus Ventricola intestinavium]|nr:SH3 domain-containing protein [Candidatus Ventricola intestinavium]
MKIVKTYIVRLIALLALLVLLPVLALAADFAVVRGGRLNLREYASSTSRSLGLYNTGSWVRLEGQAVNGWWPVRTMDGKTGYMSGNYLTFAATGNTGVVRYANGGYVNLRRGPSLDYQVITRVTSGTTVTILDASYEWNYISAPTASGTYTGYMHESFIDKSTTTSTVTTRNGGKVNVRPGPSSAYKSIGSLATGTRVTVLLKGNGWYQISGGGLTGFMSTSYLSGTGSTVGDNTGSGGGTSYQIAYVNNPRSTQVLNLRETPSQSSRSLGQYRNGTQVRVVSYGSTWCEVYVGTRHGYMMTRYLSFDGNYIPPSYPSYPSTPSTTPTPPPVQVITPTPPLVELITPVPTATPPLVEAITPRPPEAGTAVSLVPSAGGGSAINVYSDSSLTSLLKTYTSNTPATMLTYGDNVCMVIVDGQIAYVSTWNVNY